MKYITFISLLILLLCPINKLEASDNHCVQINRSKISLRYSSRADVEKILGTTSDIKYFEHGGEDFYWNDFTVCSYDERNLSFHYDENGDIIRITVNSQCNYNITLQEGPINNISFNMISDEINKGNTKDLYISKEKNFITYTKTEGISSISYSYWFNEDKSLKWFDIYYEKPW
jgi:hypothetical protein